MANTYSIIDYFDVWGNETDGWQVNNQCVVCDDLHIEEDASDDEIVGYMVSAGFLKEEAVGHVTVEDYGDGMIEISVKEDGMPLYSIRKNDIAAERVVPG